MRKRLMAAAAMAPLMLGYQAANAQSTLTISSDTSTPVATATAVGGGPGDIVINSGVTFTIKDTTPALTLNSNNNVTNGGTITSSNINNATAILVQGPFTGTVSNNGSISIGESYTPSDSANSDGITEAPYASPSSTGRIGINVTGPLTGAINNSGSIGVQGNNSVGIRIDSTVTAAPLPQGTAAVPPVFVGGSLVLNGDHNVGVLITPNGHIAGANWNPGSLYVNGTIAMKGLGSVGVQSQGQIDGALRVYGSITTTGYAITTREAGQVLTNIQKTPADVQQGGSALLVQGNVAGGVFLAAPPPGTVAGSTADLDGDGVVDAVEGTSSLNTYGSAPTVQIGGPSAITLGNFGPTVAGSYDNAYGLILEGTVSAQGIWDGVSANAVDIGPYSNGTTTTYNGVNLTGGLRVGGVVTATAYQANATAIHLEQGVTGGAILNQGSIAATVTSASASNATAIQIDAGATIGSLSNYGTIAATVNGDSANATAVVDKGGGISSVLNQGVISTALNPALPGEAVTGKSVALDLSANTTGVILTQSQNSSNASVTPEITGDVFLSKTGVNIVDLKNGTVRGSLDLGGASGSSLTIENSSVYIGALTYTGNQLKVDVASGQLLDKSPTAVGVSDLHVGATSTLGVALDPANPDPTRTHTQFNVSGTATFEAGAKISATVLSTPNLGGQTFTIVKAGTLNVGTIDSSLLSSLPYLFNGSIHTDTVANTISLNIVTKTPAQMGFNKAETAAFPGIYTALPQDAAIQTAVLSATDRSTLVSTYDQLLPSSSGDVFNTALGMSKAVSRAASDRFDYTNQPTGDDEDEGDLVTSGFWASEFYSGLWQNKADNNAYHSAALGVIGGYDFGGTGFTISAASSNITIPNQPGDGLNSTSVVEGGFYASPRFGPLSIDARVGAAYLTVSNHRNLAATIVSGDLSNSSNITRSAEGHWTGYDFTGHLGVGLDLYASKHLFFEPKVYADVFHMHEGAYSERGGGVGYDYNVSQRDSTQTNGAASLVTGLKFGNLFVVSPQLEVGYDKVLTGGPGSTTARFAYGGPTFTVPANQIGGAAMGRFTIRGDGNYVHFSLQAGGEYSSSYHSLDAKAVFRLTF
jgi:hypothetical protein